jgi:hypothetical protein
VLRVQLSDGVFVNKKDGEFAVATYSLLQQAIEDEISPPFQFDNIGGLLVGYEDLGSTIASCLSLGV